MTPGINRRYFLVSAACLATLAALPAGDVQADPAPIDLEWSDLVPSEDGFSMSRLRDLGVVQHGELSTPFDQEKGALITREYDGRRVRIPGFLIPLDFDGVGVTSFLLVPYVGACIHVPPPPPNQLIFVTTETPYEDAGLFEPVYITGVFGTAATETELADVGYAMSAEKIEPYG